MWVQKTWESARAFANDSVGYVGRIASFRSIFTSMNTVKDTLRSTVRVGYDGRVFKQFRGPDARTRCAQEVAVLQHLQAQDCAFVPLL